MNAAEKAAQAKAKAEESKLTDMFYEAQSLEARYWKSKEEWCAEGNWHEPFKQCTWARKYIKKAIKLYTKSAKGGYTQSMERLGYLYLNTLIQDKKKAFKWYKAGAENGDATCMHNLGVCYQDGVGVKPSYTKAQYWFEREEQEKK